MQDLTRRSALVAATAAAAAVVGSTAEAQQAAAAPEAGDKQRMRVATTTRIWRTFSFANVAAAVNFANLPPAQGPGEFVLTDASNGTIDGCYYF